MHAASEGFLRSMAIYVPKVRPPFLGGMVSPALIENPYSGYIMVYKPLTIGFMANSQTNSSKTRHGFETLSVGQFRSHHDLEEGEMISWQTVKWGGMVWMTTRLVQPPTWRIIPGLVSG